MSDLTRREMLRIAAVGICATCLGGEAFADDDDKPRGPIGQGMKQFPIGKLTDFPDVAIYDKYLRSNRVLISRLDDRLVAMSAVCTHKNKLVQLNSKTEIKCAAHGSLFSEQGTATKGPARVSLPRYAISQAADGTITVDTTKSFEEKKWDDAAALIKIEAEKK